MASTCTTSPSDPTGHGAASVADALRHSPLAALALRGQDPALGVNCLFLAGVLATDPLEDQDREGKPITLLLIVFPAPDSKDTADHLETASCEVEVPDPVVQRYSQKLRAGVSIFITGQLSGGGGILARELDSLPSPE